MKHDWISRSDGTLACRLCAIKWPDMVNEPIGCILREAKTAVDYGIYKAGRGW